MAQAALWVVCVCYLVAALKDLVRRTDFPRQYLLSAALALLPAGVVLLFLAMKQSLIHSPIPPATLGPYTITNLPFFGSTGMFVAGWAVWEMYVVCSILRGEFKDKPSDGRMKLYIELREIMLRLLFIAGVVLALGTLAGAALRNAVNADKGENYFPQEYVVIYGGLYSLLLLAAYAPLYGSFFVVGVKLREGAIGEAPATGEDFKTWREKRDALNDSLGLTLSGASALGPPLSALLPLLSGWAVSLLGAKK